MKVYLDSIGCRLNHSEMATLARQLMAAGHEIVSDAHTADQVVINTCAVTAAAAADARKRTRRIHRQNEAADILLTGCYATIAPDELAAVKGAGRVVVNDQKAAIAQMIDPAAPAEPVYEREPILREFHGTAGSHTRAFIKVQDGCDNKCTFCVTTVARGGGQSRHLADVITEIRGLAEAGYQEAVLTGVHLGSYGHDMGNQTGLRELVEAILKHTDIPRLRLSSLEPWDIADGFFELWADPRLLPHLHMPLQSGSDRILRRMARRTRRDSFRGLVEDARANIPDLNLTTDVIVGFPGETEADFGQTMQFVEEIGFSRLHAFTYSRRPGTAAADMSGQVHGATRKERIGRLLDLEKRLGMAYHRRYDGRTVKALWESAVGANGDGLKWVGYTDNYMRITTYGPAELGNTVTPVRITAVAADQVQGEIVTEPTP